MGDTREDIVSSAWRHAAGFVPAPELRPGVKTRQITSVAVKNPAYHPLFMTMCSTYAFIDRSNGRFNRAMDFKKDYAALIGAAWDLDRACDQYLRDPEADAYDVVKKLGIDLPPRDDSAAEQWNYILEKIIESNPGAYRDRYYVD